MSDLDKRLENVIQRRTNLVAQIQRIEGKKQHAEDNLRAAEEACRAKKVDPNTIDATIDKIKKMFEGKVEELEQEVEKAEELLAPFLGEDS